MIKVNKLSLNTSKKFFFYSTPFRDIAIAQENVTQLFGVLLDENISWKPYTDMTCSKIFKTVGIIYKARQIICKNQLKLLKFSFINSYLFYANIIWGITQKK